VDTLQSPDPIIHTKRCDAELYKDAASCWTLGRLNVIHD